MASLCLCSTPESAQAGGVDKLFHCPGLLPKFQVRTPAQFERTGRIDRSSNALAAEGSASSPGSAEISRAYRHVPLALDYPLELDVPTFASDFNSAVNNERLAGQLSAQYIKDMEKFAFTHSMDLTARDPLARDRGSTRPFLMTQAEEVAVRKRMAKSFLRYSYMRGIPQFLATREDTKDLASTYVAVVGSTHVGGVTKDSWKYGVGVNPFERKAAANYYNKKWSFETSTKFESEASLRGSWVFYGGYSWTENRFEIQYWPMSKLMRPARVFFLMPNLSARIEQDIPLANPQPMKNGYTRVSMKYAF